MTGYWDIHNHILPGVDDGSGCMSETMQMLQEEYQQGVRHVVFTPHYRRGMFAIPREEIQIVYERVCEAAREQFVDMEFYLGCEYYVHKEDTGIVLNDISYQMPGARSVLLEFSYEKSFQSICEIIRKTVQSGMIPILAHIERYECLCGNLNNVASLRNDGAKIQINADSLLGKHGFGMKRFCMKVLKEDIVDFIASDAHDTVNRTVNMKAAIEVVRKKYGSGKAESIFVTGPEQLLR